MAEQEPNWGKVDADGGAYDARMSIARGETPPRYPTGPIWGAPTGRAGKVLAGELDEHAGEVTRATEENEPTTIPVMQAFTELQAAANAVFDKLTSSIIGQENIDLDDLRRDIHPDETSIKLTQFALDNYDALFAPYTSIPRIGVLPENATVTKRSEALNEALGSLFASLGAIVQIGSIPENLKGQLANLLGDARTTFFGDETVSDNEVLDRIRQDMMLQSAELLDQLAAKMDSQEAHIATTQNTAAPKQQKRSEETPLYVFGPNGRFERANGADRENRPIDSQITTMNSDAARILRDVEDASTIARILDISIYEAEGLLPKLQADTQLNRTAIPFIQWAQDSQHDLLEHTYYPKIAEGASFVERSENVLRQLGYLLGHINDTFNPKAAYDTESIDVKLKQRLQDVASAYGIDTDGTFTYDMVRLITDRVKSDIALTYAEQFSKLAKSLHGSLRTASLRPRNAAATSEATAPNDEEAIVPTSTKYKTGGVNYDALISLAASNKTMNKLLESKPEEPQYV